MTARTNLVLDLTITAAFLTISNPPLTGMAVHEWLGVSLGAAMLVHVLFHWEWVVGISSRLFRPLAQGVRLNYVVDWALFVTFTAAVLSGLLSSEHLLPALGIQVGPARGWRGVHHLTANLSLVAVAVHLGLHWTWVATQLGQLFGLSARKARPAVPPLRDGASV